MKIKEILAACLLLAATGCTFTDEPQVCPYSTRIEYWYAGNTFENALPAYANSLRQYLFDEEGNLGGCKTVRSVYPTQPHPKNPCFGR